MLVNTRPQGNGPSEKGPPTKRQRTRTNTATATEEPEIKVATIATAIEEPEIKVATIEDYANLSIVSLYNFIRFKAFLGNTNDEKKALFLASATIPLLESSVFKQVVAAVNNNNFKQMKAIVDKDNMKDGRGVIRVAPGTWPRIVDAYFMEPMELIAGDLLRTLVHFRGDPESLDRFIENYKADAEGGSSTEDRRSRLVSGLIPSSLAY